MQPIKRNTLKLSASLALVVALLASGFYQWRATAASLPATPCAYTGAAAITCDLWAKAGSATMPDGAYVTIWGYAASAADPAGLPGPVLIVNQGDVVTVNLANNLPVTTALLFGGQAMAPDAAGVAAGGTKAYTFTATRPGTYLYQASPLLPHAETQVAMGLYGALVVRPSAAGQAYDSAASAFNGESLLVLGEIDPALNNSADPAMFDIRNYHPRYFLINGKSYPQTDSIDALAGDKVLLRMVNAGLQSHSLTVLGLSQTAIAVDGSPYNHARKVGAETIFPGQTADMIVSVPASTALGSRFAIYDANFILSSNSGRFGGMLTFIRAGAPLPPPPTDTVGPLTAGVAVSPEKVDGLTGSTLSATISDDISGGSAISAVEYFLGAPGANGTGIAMAFAAGTSVTASAPVGPFPTTGMYTFYVHGQDAAGNWGPFSSAVLAVDASGPAVTAWLKPNPSGGAGVILGVSADDRATGSSYADLIEYSVDGGPTASLSPLTSASASYFEAGLPAQGTAGVYQVSIRAHDEFGNWSDWSILDLTVDKTGPDTTGVTATPGTTNGLVGVNSSVAAVRVTASFADGVSNLAGAEGFMGTLGISETGFPFIASDGLFDSLSETGYIDIPLSVFWSLNDGTYLISVHARDASGNWGPAATTTVTVQH